METSRPGEDPLRRTESSGQSHEELWSQPKVADRRSGAYGPDEFQRRLATDAATGGRVHVATQALRVKGNARLEIDVHDVVLLGFLGVRAVGDPGDGPPVRDDALRIEKAGRQFEVVAGRAERHGHPMADPLRPLPDEDTDLQGLLGGQLIVPVSFPAVPDLQDRKAGRSPGSLRHRSLRLKASALVWYHTRLSRGYPLANSQSGRSGPNGTRFTTGRPPASGRPPGRPERRLAPRPSPAPGTEGYSRAETLRSWPPPRR
jgi:hypothetical protein